MSMSRKPLNKKFNLIIGRYKSPFEVLSPPENFSREVLKYAVLHKELPNGKKVDVFWISQAEKILST